jgi:D-glycerate 3-kinase
MTLQEILRRVAAGADADRAAKLAGALGPTVPDDWRHLAVALALAIESDAIGDAGTSGALVLGIGGGQGAGKTTLAGALVDTFERLGRRALSMSLDDFYLTRSERERLGREVHPLLATRGVPGTHDVGLAVSVIETLKAGGRAPVPVFDKSKDDRAIEQPDRGGGLDVLIFEGWCVGVPPQPAEALALPVNDLERDEDPDGRWRNYVNDQLEHEYPPLWALMDRLLFLKVPDMNAVLRWRTAQEQQHPPEKRMDAAALKRFVSHYERLTGWMGEALPGTADMVGLLDRDHRLADLIVR